MSFRFSGTFLIRALLICASVALGYGASGVLDVTLRGSDVAQAQMQTVSVATILPDPVPLPDFSLHDQAGTPFTRDSLKGNWSFLFFGYTHCPDICPMTLTVLKDTDKILIKEGVEPKARIIFVSVDPERDTDKQRADYVAGYNPDFISVTGTEGQLSVLGRSFGIAYQRSNGSTATGDYLMEHSAVILLVDPQARLRAILTPPHDAEDIAREYRKIIAAM